MILECVFSGVLALSGSISPSHDKNILEPLLLLAYAYMHSAPDEVHSTAIETPDYYFDTEIPSHKDKDCLTTDLEDDELDLNSEYEDEDDSYEVSIKPAHRQLCNGIKMLCSDEYNQHIRQYTSDESGSDRSGEDSSEEDHSEEESSEDSGVDEQDQDRPEGSSGNQSECNTQSNSSLKQKIAHWRSSSQLLGSGSFCDVFLINILDEGQRREVAVKVRKKETSKTKMAKKKSELFGCLKQEAKVLGEITHENVVKLIRVEIGDQEEIAVLYLEYLPYCLRHLMADSMLFNLQQAFSHYHSLHGFIEMFSSLVNALKYLHDRNILYPDLHSYNVRLNDRGVVVLADFGKLFKLNTLEAWPYAAASCYLAPEIKEGKPVTVKGQIYGVGLLLIQILESRCIEVDNNSQTLIEERRLQNKSTLLRPLIKKWKETVVAEYAGLLDTGYQCCQINPDQRPDFGQLDDCLVNILDVFEIECPDSDDECPDDDDRSDNESPPEKRRKIDFDVEEVEGD
ncbi:hypothetical protein GZ77_15190 [Endozoicomonas montiporae]|uniref:Protein kinase domain-containing protein n=1 Tax=Endozoicomonas montiporae TaxID=1027273 RepID=A0A081N5C7_9GAMM|nr:hypothetical protein GZ77_15190 [Endozoicomonas montiporae]